MRGFRSHSSRRGSGTVTIYYCIEGLTRITKNATVLLVWKPSPSDSRSLTKCRILWFSDMMTCFAEDVLITESEILGNVFSLQTSINPMSSMKFVNLERNEERKPTTSPTHVFLNGSTFYNETIHFEECERLFSVIDQNKTLFFTNQKFTNGDFSVVKQNGYEFLLMNVKKNCSSSGSRRGNNGKRKKTKRKNKKKKKKTECQHSKYFIGEMIYDVDWEDPGNAHLKYSILKRARKKGEFCLMCAFRKYLISIGWFGTIIVKQPLCQILLNY